MKNSAPAPNGCRYCGIEERGHGRQYTAPAGGHAWTAPTERQTRDRMLARRAERKP